MSPRALSGSTARSDVERRLGLGALTDAEHVLISSLLSSKPAVLSEADPSTDGDELAPVRAEVLRAIVLGRAYPAERIDPQGLVVEGAAVVGALMLDDIDLGHALWFFRCRLDDGLSLTSASLRGLYVVESVVGAGEGGRAIDCFEMRTRHSVEIRDCTVDGGISLIDAHIGGTLSMRGSFTAGSGSALVADRLRTGGTVTIDGTVVGTGDEGAVRAVGAAVGGQVTCRGSFTNRSGPALVADGLACASDVALDGTFDAAEGDAVRLLGARVEGQMSCGGRFVSAEGAALGADRIVVRERLEISGSYRGGSKTGAIRLSGAEVVGQLAFRDGTVVVGTSGSALNGDGLRAPAAVILRGRFAGAGDHGAVRLTGAQLGSDLVAEDVVCTNDSGPALLADALSGAGDVLLAGEFSGEGELGSSRLQSVRVVGDLVCSGVFQNGTGPAVELSGAVVEGNVMLKIRAEGSGESAAVRLLGTRVSGDLMCSQSEVTNTTGPALGADRLVVDRRVTLSGKFTGEGSRGTIRLSGARIAGQLALGPGAVANGAGVAVLADSATVSDQVFVRGEITGAGDLGAVRLQDARIGGLSVRGATIGNATGPAVRGSGLVVDGSVRIAATLVGGELRGAGGVVLADSHVRGDLALTPRASARDAGPGALDLTGTTVDQTVTLATPSPPDGAGRPWLSVDRLTFSRLVLVGPSGREPEPLEVWARLLAGSTTAYAPQPWQHLAAVHRAAGHEHDAKKVLIAQQDDRGRRVLRPSRPWRQPGRWVRYRGLRLSRALTGYGYRMTRTFGWLAVLAAVAVLVGLATGWVQVDRTLTDGSVSTGTVAAHGRLTADEGGPCSLTERVGLGVEWAVPVISTGASSSCVLDRTSVAGQWFTVGSWLLQLSGWALATLVVAGYTGLVRRL